MPANIDTAAQRQRKKEAFQSALLSSVMRGCLAVALIWLGIKNHSGTTTGILFLALAVINLGTIVLTWKAYNSRVKEIEGGEEDAAAQY